MSQNDHCTLPSKPPPPMRGSKTQNGHFRCKIVLHLKKVCYTVFCVKTVSNRVVRHSLAYNYPCRNDWWGSTPSTLNFRSEFKLIVLDRNRRFSIYFRARIAPPRMWCESAYKRCERWKCESDVKINAAGIHPRFVWNLKVMSSYKPMSKGKYRPYFRVTFPFRLDIGSMRSSCTRVIRPAVRTLSVYIYYEWRDISVGPSNQ